MRHFRATELRSSTLERSRPRTEHAGRCRSSLTCSAHGMPKRRRSAAPATIALRIPHHARRLRILHASSDPTFDRSQQRLQLRCALPMLRARMGIRHLKAAGFRCPFVERRRADPMRVTHICRRPSARLLLQDRPPRDIAPRCSAGQRMIRSSSKRHPFILSASRVGIDPTQSCRRVSGSRSGSAVERVMEVGELSLGRERLAAVGTLLTAFCLCHQ